LQGDGRRFIISIPVEVILEELTLEELTSENMMPETQQLSSSTWIRFFLDVLETILLAAILFLLINGISARVRVQGFSMVPSLQDGEFVLVNRLAYRLGQPQRGDIIVFHHPTDQNQEDLVKRVIGLPGDDVKVEGGGVYVNGVRLKENYINAEPAYADEKVVPEGQLYVLGDNRNQSSDSHAWGFVPYKQVIGAAIFIYWPLKELSLIQHNDLIKASQ
jgi:signal peptidase I